MSCLQKNERKSKNEEKIGLLNSLGNFISGIFLKVFINIIMVMFRNCRETKFHIIRLGLVRLKTLPVNLKHIDIVAVLVIERGVACITFASWPPSPG